MSHLSGEQEALLEAVVLVVARGHVAVGGPRVSCLFQWGEICVEPTEEGQGAGRRGGGAGRGRGCGADPRRRRSGARQGRGSAAAAEQSGGRAVPEAGPLGGGASGGAGAVPQPRAGWLAGGGPAVARRPGCATGGGPWPPLRAPPALAAPGQCKAQARPASPSTQDLRSKLARWSRRCSRWFRR